MVNRAIRRELLEKLGITKQALSQRAKKLKESYGPMTTEEAVYVIAHQEGIDLAKHLSLAVLDRIRSLVPRPVTSGPSKPRTRSKVSGAPFRPTAGRYPLVTPALSSSGATLGQQVYPILFILENSIRSLISTRLSNTGPDWWDRLVPPYVQTNVKRTMAREKRFPWREKRGSHSLYYANFSDLKAIIVANFSHFNDVIVNIDWFKVMMDDIYMARNNLAHCIPLPKDDITRIRLFHRDWARLLETAGIR